MQWHLSKFTIFGTIATSQKINCSGAWTEFATFQQLLCRAVTIYCVPRSAKCS
jgi:hypothetical protein